MLQNFQYLYKKKTQVVFFVFHFEQLSSFPYGFKFGLCKTLSNVDIDQGIHKVKMKVARNEKQKKLLVFSLYINVGNFEAFLQKF